MEYGFACQTECLKEQEQQGRESQQVKSDEKQSGDHDMDGQGDQQQSKPDVKQEQKGSADEQLQKQVCCRGAYVTQPSSVSLHLKKAHSPLHERTPHTVSHAHSSSAEHPGT